MALEGTLRDFHVADIVQLIGLQRKTGVLTLEVEEDIFSLTFQDGAVIWAQSHRVSWEDRLQRVLVERGLLSEAKLQEALAVQKETGQKLQYILGNRGILGKEAWDEAQALEVHEAVCRIFRWKVGRYRFATLPTVDTAEGRIDPIGAENLLLEGIRRLDEWPLIQKSVPSMAMVFRREEGRTSKADPQRLEPPERKVLALVDGRRPVQSIVDASALGEFEACRALASLVSSGLVVGRDVQVPVAAAPRAPAAAPSLPAWAPLGLWAVVAAWLLVNLIVFQADPLGIVPLSPARRAQEDLVRTVRARAEMAGLARAVEGYAVDHGAVPPTLEAVVQRVPPDLVTLRDPWGQAYVYEPGGLGFRLVSPGADGRMGTADDLILTVGGGGHPGARR